MISLNPVNWIKENRNQIINNISKFLDSLIYSDKK
ncbi:hypothetical protein SAMN05444366_3230 [Flavobacterium saccharophilum]|uniref:Uncharacterized protein n=1 Tax=Flavobacterium saccharophilum TaxID=29534 RepID=A0A1M7INQ4_9FLAO|nr:hypothetical protein SAMN05444366_3230 [Flavobacterium saccharophilum]